MGVVLAVVLAGAGVFAAYQMGLVGAEHRALPGTVVLALACEGEDGAIVTPVVATFDTSTGSLTGHDPLAQVTIPGTTYDRLRDAYAFGGGPAVAAATVQLTGGVEPAHVVLGADAWAAAVEAEGGVTLDSPRTVDVFTGEELFVFPSGRQVLGAADACQYLKGAAYFADTERVRVAEQFAAALAAVVANVEFDTDGVSTDLSAEAFEDLRRTLR